jgi:hypothetical protein
MNENCSLSEAPEPKSEHPTKTAVQLLRRRPRTIGGTETGVDPLRERRHNLTEADRVRRDSQGFQADNARVPEYLWDDRAMEVALAGGVDRDKRPRCK